MIIDNSTGEIIQDADELNQAQTLSLIAPRRLRQSSGEGGRKPALIPVERGFTFQIGPFMFTTRALHVIGKPSFDRYEAAVLVVQELRDRCQFWLGDLLNYGEKRWGETYAQAAEQSGYTEESLANMKWVADRVESSLRNDNLSYSHHVAVAPLAADEQKEWLDKAENEGLNVKQLRAAISRPQLPPNSNGRMLGQIDHSSLTVTLWPRTQEDVGSITDRMNGLVEWR